MGLKARPSALARDRASRPDDHDVSRGPIGRTSRYRATRRCG